MRDPNGSLEPRLLTWCRGQAGFPRHQGAASKRAIRQMPWVVKGKVKPRWVTQLGLSFDHRMVNGDLGSRFLADVAAILHDPGKALVWG